MKFQRVIFIVCLMSLMLATNPLAYAQDTATPSATSDATAALHILAELNVWRIEAGVPPLKTNDTLENLALQQAAYLSTLSEIEGGNALHLGPNGEGPRERAAAAGWPGYGGALGAIAEVGAVGTPESAMKFWWGSELHTQTINHPGMREVGVAAVPHVWGHIYIVVLGSRPDVLPALFDPKTGLLYLTQDTWKYGLGNIPPMQIRFLDENGQPLTEWQGWQPSVPLPGGVNSRFYVQYNDGGSEITTEVDLERDYIVLPEYLPPSP